MTREIVPEDRAQQKTHFTTCYMCACRCGIKVTVENNRVRFIEGNRDHPVNHGVICAKGSAGIMKQYSPARLRKPLKRREGAERGAGDFVEIEWDEALDELTARLKKIRSSNPTQLAFFTGRDQMQALSGLWAQQFGTPNWAAHGGFCSVNMAVAGLSVRRPGSQLIVPHFDAPKVLHDPNPLPRPAPPPAPSITLDVESIAL